MKEATKALPKLARSFSPPIDVRLIYNTFHTPQLDSIEMRCRTKHIILIPPENGISFILLTYANEGRDKLGMKLCYEIQHNFKLA